MRTPILLFAFALTVFQLKAQILYKTSQLALPSEFDKQICVSGLVYFDNKLLMASERCPTVVAITVDDLSIKTVINTQIKTAFEMEGITIYNGDFFLISENLAGVYRLKIEDGSLSPVPTSTPLPNKLKSGDGMEGIATNEKNEKFYLLRERNEQGNAAQLSTYTFDKQATALVFTSTIELPLENSDWRYADICFDEKNSRILCLKSYSKGKIRKHKIDALGVDEKGNPIPNSIITIVPEGFSFIPNKVKANKLSLNFEGLTLDEKGNIYIVSDNTSGQADCAATAKEKTVLLKLSPADSK